MTPAALHYILVAYREVTLRRFIPAAILAALALFACDDGAYDPADAELDCGPDYRLRDGEIGCGCARHTRRCEPEGEAICDQLGPDGCWEWSDPEPCPEGMRCAREPDARIDDALGLCREIPCDDDACNPGDSRCAGPGAVNTCVAPDGICPRWSLPEDCPDGTRCIDGECQN